MAVDQPCVLLPIRTISPLRTYHVMPPASRSWVTRSDTFSTVPTTSPVSMTSPTPYWSSTIMKTPDRKSLTRLCAPKPSATPPTLGRRQHRAERDADDRHDGQERRCRDDERRDAARAGRPWCGSAARAARFAPTRLEGARPPGMRARRSACRLVAVVDDPTDEAVQQQRATQRDDHA